MDGRCTCGAVSYRMTQKPMFMLACHCTWCQRETGSAFGLYALIEMACVELLADEPEEVEVATPSGKGQTVCRCRECKVALWSHYGLAGPKLAFVRVGTLDEPAAFPPQLHMFTASKVPWLVLDGAVPVTAEGFEESDYFSAESLVRLAALAAQG